MLIKYLCLLLSLGMCCVQANAQYYKWVDKNGNVTYSSKPPPQGAKQQKIDTIRSLGTPLPAPRSNYSSQTTTTNNSYTANTANKRLPVNTNASAYERSEEEELLRQKRLKEASTPIPGAKGLTASQRNVLAGLNTPTSSAPPTIQRPPSVITNCDTSGCWGSDGTRYNKGAGNTYFPSTGGTCIDVGGQMQCH
ncbi:DUF4124 domain-containing protein [Acinetobacter thermotolerans]|uniref:DUF4124 domain-containing protein n=1 Tax=Acinetobacter thermotolerans TaxID=3151487 RepID=UPI00325A576B